MKRFFYFFLLILIPASLFAGGLELPSAEPEDIINHNWFSLEYNESTEQAFWAAYELTREELLGRSPRKDNFRSDPAISTGSAETDDYRGSGYDRGHLVPAADLKMTPESMNSSFLLSNICPQTPELNRGAWLELENYVRTWAWEYSSVYVAAGPVFSTIDNTVIGNNEVGVPDAFFKVVLVYNGEKKQAAGFIIPNDGIYRKAADYLVSVDAVESLSGLDFFYQLPDDIEEAIEAETETGAWIWKEFNFNEIKQNKKETPVIFDYWINTGTDTRHNSGCEYYGNTKNGYYTNEKKGRACGRCGG